MTPVVQTRFKGALGFNADEVQQWVEQHGSRAIKREYTLKGYEYALSLYGTLWSAAEEQGWTPRIEVLSPVQWTETIVASIYGFFKELKPKWYYSIWVYSPRRQGVKMVWHLESGPR